MSKIDLNKAMSHKGRDRLGSFKWQEKRERILKRDKGRCVNCGSTEDLEIDHKIAVTLGGTDEDDNLVTLCKSCHQMKTREDLEKKRRLRKFQTYSRRIGGFD